MVGIIVLEEVFANALAQGLLDVLDVLVIGSLTEELLDGKLDALDKMDESVCDWGIFYHLSEILEQKLTSVDQQALENYKHELEDMEGEFL